MFIQCKHVIKRCFCAEAEYAFNLGKPIIPLRLEAGYRPDGWLGPLCINNLYYDFTKPEEFKDSWEKLREDLSETLRPIPSITADTGTTGAR